MSLVSRVNDLAAAVRDKFNLITATLALKAPLNSPAFTGTPTGITKGHVGLGNVDNTSDAAKPVSTAQQAAIDAKPNLATSGTPAAVGTASRGTASTAARSDHVHAHGNQAGGALHADATTSVAGFMPAAALTKLNGIAAGATANSTESVGTSNNTILKRDGSGNAFAGLITAENGGFYAGTGGTHTMTRSGSNLAFSVACTAPSFTPTSDRRLKKHLKAVRGSVARTMAIRPTDFTLKAGGQRARGFIAQELQAVDPIYVRENDETGLLSIDPVALLADAIATIQSLEGRISKLEKSSTGA